MGEHVVGMSVENHATAHRDSYALAASRVAVIGLDCAVPELVLRTWRNDLPNLSALLDTGFGGILESVIPPITVPAWTCMLSGRDPGELGIYGFRNRLGHAYDSLEIATAEAVRFPRVWDFLGDAGLRSIVLGVPQTYPPRPIHGLMVGCFLTPNKSSVYTYPRRLKSKIDAWAGGEYFIDVPDFRTDDKQRLLADIYAMTQARFRLASKLLEQTWDFFMMVEMGPDRLHHGFWKYHDREHPLHEPNNPFKSVVYDYYKTLDVHIGELVDTMPDDTLVLVVSDHGAKSMKGGFAFNQWLIDKGLLALKDPSARGRLTPDMVDWPNTKVWGDGGYYARVFFNVQGREPEGTVHPDDYEPLRRQLAEELENLTDADGKPMGNLVLFPERLYRDVKGVPPDLIVLIGDLAWRSVAGVGLNSVYTRENDTGPDYANHDVNGLILGGIKGSVLPPVGEDRILPESLGIRSICPTVLKSLGVPCPPDMPVDAIDPWAAQSPRSI